MLLFYFYTIAKQSDVDSVIYQWLRACVCAKGRHFEQLLDWNVMFC